jgi:amino acid transporter
MMAADANSAAATGPHNAREKSYGLAQNRVGVLGIVFFVIAAAAPLTVVVALFPVILASGNGIGIAGTFVLVSAVLLLFSVGFVAMSRHITNTGAFYSYITQGLGRPMGLGAASMVIFSYNAIQLGLYGGIGYYAEAYVSSRVGVHLPWWLYSFAALLACLMLGIRRIEAGAAVLAVLLTLETGIIVLLDGSILWHQRAALAQLSLAPFSVNATLAGSLGVALMFAHASFIGFEGTAIYGEEARDPKRTIPRATYIAVIFMGVFYSVTAWLIVNSLGVDKAVEVAKQTSANLVFVVGESNLGRVGAEIFQLFVISSMFAAILTFHNNVARYLFSLGRQGVIWKGLGHTHPRSQSPHLACYLQSLMVGVVIAVFAIAGLQPYDTLFTWFTGIGAAGMIAVQCMASIAVFVFFRRNPVDKRRWNTFIAPLLGIAGLLPFIYFALTSLDLLIGATGVVQWLFLAMLVASFAIGIAAAFSLRAWAPARYSRLASSLGDQSH